MEGPPPGRNVKLVVAYDGTRYHGWQRQADGVDTVQERLRRAIICVVGHPVTVHGAGRTDARVHALGQVASFLTTSDAIPLGSLRQAVNARLPADISVRSARVVSPRFHASRGAVGKTYRYRIHTGPIKPVMLVHRVWHFWRGLDVRAMQDAAARLVGQHDFRGLTCADEQRLTTVRTITRCEVAEGDDEVQVTVSGNGFLYRMVRNLVGTLAEIGRGHWKSERIDEILQTRDRSLAGPTAPPGGLYLLHVEYPPELEDPSPEGVPEAAPAQGSPGRPADRSDDQAGDK